MLRSDVFVAPGAISGIANVPVSKSLFQRYVALAFHSNVPVTICNFSPAADNLTALTIYEDCGGKIFLSDERVTLYPILSQKKKVHIHCGESGLASRMFTPMLSSKFQNLTVSGSGSLLNRNMSEIADILIQGGVSVRMTKNKLPLKCSGLLASGTYKINKPDSSQIITGLLFTLPFLNGNSTLVINQPVSIPYMQMSIQVLNEAGINVEVFDAYSRIGVEGNQKMMNQTFFCESDWSSAATLLVAAAMNGGVTVQNLSETSNQADVAVISILKQCGAMLTSLNSEITIKKSNKKLKPFKVDATHFPDLIPILCALATQCIGESVITGTNRLTNKESNREQVIFSNFKRLGIPIRKENNSFVISAFQINEIETFNAFNDHRMAFCGTLLALCSKQGLVISDRDCVKKSYANFFEEIHRLQLHAKSI